MDKKYCFAYKYNKNKERYECTALHNLYCEIEGGCNFYKTQGQLDKQIEECKKRKNQDVL